MSTVSITIPARNEENYIEKCLQSIVNANFPKDKLDVYVCDGLSTDKTVEIVKKYENEYSFIHLLTNEKKTTPYALNLGVRASRTDYKIILGAHAIIEPDFILENIKIYEELNDEKIACVGGIVENIYENEDSKIIGLAMSSPFGVGNAHYRTGNKSRFVDTVLFGAYKSEIFEKIGYFDNSLTRNQDDEFNYRLLKNGYKIFLSQNVKSKYYVRSSLPKLFKQHYQYGYWKVVVNRKHKNITTFRQIVPLIFVLFLIIGFISSWIYIYLTYFYFLGVLFYFLVASFEASKKKLNFKSKYKLVKTFFILHFSYGLGYLSAIKDLLFLRTFATEKNINITR